MVDWHVEGLRLSAFLPGQAEPRTDASWGALMDGEPDEQRIQGVGLQRVITQHGSFGTGRIRVEKRVGRTDWFFDPATPPLGAPGHVTAPYSPTEEAFRAKMCEWLSSSRPEVIRLAFGASLSYFAGDLSASLAAVEEMIPLNLDSRDAMDFVYQINRRRPSRTSDSGLRINRLSRWSIVENVMGAVELQSGGTAPRMVVTDKRYACTLTLDINTVAEHEAVLADPVSLYTELTEMGNEIVARGDIP